MMDVFVRRMHDGEQYVFFCALSIKVVLTAPTHSRKMRVLSEFFWKSEQTINRSDGFLRKSYQFLHESLRIIGTENTSTPDLCA
jgi:hypothetical protein